MDQGIRNKLRNVVTQCRKLLEDATAQALQGRFGIYAAGKRDEVQIESESRMEHLPEEDRACRQDLLDHLEHIKAIGYKPREAMDQLVREIAFTHLNRLCAYKMMEARGLIREAVSRGPKSQGFFFYLADHPNEEMLHNSGQEDVAYRNYLDWLGGTLSQEIGFLFNPNDPANHIYSPQRVLDEVLSLINDEELKGIWTEDETIGWVYQYFTPKELRDRARKESQAPRNSYELAFRNQFYTPRYVVEFLTDNTLSRIWYEMRKGRTVLKDRCRYLVRRHTEIFLKEAEEPPAQSKNAREDLSQEELFKQPVYIPHRPKKDPREIKILDPACGSGHFLLYCSDLLQVIYEEAYDDPDLSTKLRKDYPTLGDLRRAVPGLILKHNLHGIDIDLRATQIAALALWLRCQRAYQELSLKNGERPTITRTNVVCAEPMPGETDFLKEFTATLQPKVLGQLVEVVFEKMKLAGEAGSLLKVEEEIRDAAMTAKKEYQEELRRQKEQAGYLLGMAPPRERTLFDFSDMTDNEFLDRAEEEIVAALRRYAEKASNGRTYRKRLFAEDAARGFSFVDVCSKKYDVVLMNPPFGECSTFSKPYISGSYPESKNDILGPFVEMGLNRLHDLGTVGAITSRTAFFLSSMEKWRRRTFFERSTLNVFCDLGEGVLDSAMVKTAAYVVEKTKKTTSLITFIDVSRSADRGEEINEAVAAVYSNNGNNSLLWLIPSKEFEILPGSPLPYWAPPDYRQCFSKFSSLEKNGIEIKQGLGTTDDFRFVRCCWEVPACSIGNGKRWRMYAKGGESQSFFGDIHLLVNWEDGGREIYNKTGIPYGGAGAPIRNPSYYFRSGLTYTSYTNKGFLPRVLPTGCIFTTAGMGIFCEEPMVLLGVLNSRVVQSLLSMITDNRKWEVGYVQKLPLPTLTKQSQSRLAELARQCWKNVRLLSTWDEVSRVFIAPFADSEKVSLRDIDDRRNAAESAAFASVDACKSQLNTLVASVYGLSDDSSCRARETCEAELGDEGDVDEQGSVSGSSQAVTSYSVGAAFGRWDVRLAIGERSIDLGDNPFDEPLSYPPGILQGPDGLPAKPEEVASDYPLHIDWDGILVDDPEHEEDIIRRVRDVLEVIWKDCAEAIEREACEILGVGELRDYFRKPGNGGFWMDHVKRYSKSRRKAPIYWYLRSAKGNYGLWFYYHLLDKDILFKALLNYVEPKIRLVEDRLNTLRARKEGAGASGREAKQIEKDMDRQEQFVSELHDFADKLRRVADWHIEPDLNDGVALNIAPLWELVPWKEAKDCWESLIEGKYEWSSIGKQLRKKGRVK